MNKNILIYGFGWTGRATLHLCEAMGCDCKVVDDGLDMELYQYDERFITYSTLATMLKDNIDLFDLFLIAVSDKPEIACKIKNKILNLINFDYKIRCISLNGYQHYYKIYFKQYFACASTFIEFLLKDTYKLVKFSNLCDRVFRTAEIHEHNIGTILVDKYNGNNSNRKILYKGLFDFVSGIGNKVMYPGFIIEDFIFQEDNIFGRKKNINFQALKNRKNRMKIVALFGGCQFRQSNIDTYLENKLNELSDKFEFIVIDCSDRIYNTTYGKMLLYTTLFYSLKIDYVVNLFFSDVMNYPAYYEQLLKNHDIFLTDQFNNDDIRGIRMTKGDYSINDVIHSLQIRLKQFNDMVIANNGEFIPIIQPILTCKKELTREEEIYLKINKDKNNEDCIHQEAPKLIQKLLKSSDITIYDSNDSQIKNSNTKTVFKDYRHLTDYGLDLLGDYIYSVLVDKIRHKS